MGKDDRRIVFSAAIVLLVMAVLPAGLLLGPLHLGEGEAARLAAVLTFIGVLVTSSVSLIGFMVNRQTERRLQTEQVEQSRQLRLDSAMRAGQLIAPADGGSSDPAALASGLLALTKLDNADLAVTLLVDLWSPENPRVSHETAVLVIDAALRSRSSNALLIAAELLCRHSTRLNACQSLHWPSAVEGCWVPDLSPRAKLLLVEALLNMTLAGSTNESALRAIAVRLYGIWRNDPEDRVRGCIGKLIDSLIGRLNDLGYKDFMQGTQQVMLSELQEAARSRSDNPDGYLDRLSTRFADELRDWAQQCEGLPTEPGCLATAD
ncbi:hypothetical protein [Actinomadura rudentiformis]|uniref:Uncharacterized protein n=1 Tax=Actinomadura rudentiformis TaxID=359158 RepID=A0A6H9Y8T1_9ACTN|nr:hypothetical protein [Actinomadura rudentiformis]KAB2339661.1 hypothetical protein F8566_47490 [Actinomadura rudentiformis]